jgi:hypothetical protein
MCCKKLPFLLFREKRRKNWRKTREYSVGEGEGEGAGAGREVDGGKVRGDHQVAGGRQSNGGEGGVRREAEGAGGRVIQKNFSHLIFTQLFLRKF